MNITARTIALANTAGMVLFANLALDVTDFAPFYGLIAIGFGCVAVVSFADAGRKHFMGDR